MLVVNRYENRQTGKVTIQAHVIKGKKLIKSYAPCCQRLIDMIAQKYSFYLLCDVDYHYKLKKVNIVNAKWVNGMKFNIDDLKDLTERQVLLVINFATLASWADNENQGLYNCYLENADILQVAKNKLKLSNAEADFLYHFFLENDHY